MESKSLTIPVLLLVLTIFRFQVTTAQEDSAKALSLSGYMETYYSYDFDHPGTHVRQPFLYNFNRHNEFNLNLGLIKLAYQTTKVRGNLALMAGTYPNDNLSAEPGVMKNVFEANAGIKISGSKNLWLDAGIFSSHLGFESAIGKDCWNLSRSLLAENSPYYLSGLKVTYISGDAKWVLSGLVVNGWQRIYRVDGNNTPAFGHQLSFKPSPAITLNSSSFIGSDKPDQVRQLRFFHNFYGIFQVNDRMAFTTGFDFGAEESAIGNGEYNTWYAPVLLLKWSPGPKWNLAARLEYYSDANGVIIATGAPHGFKTWGYSLNLDFPLYDQVLWRVEGRGFKSKDPLFNRGGPPSKTNASITTSLAISF
ncbi:MAG TPA: porin [Saprospiraceae bacterium]|nr:porin [Saprospiraceae bacterium]HNT21448.1 porin [Saprospiraceae bacterium]